jgi:hypothetical protein
MGHIMKKLFATVTILGLGFGVVAGEPSPSAPTVSELIYQLGSEDYRDREAAAAALEKAGPSAIPALRKAMNSENPEVRLRIAPILVKLERAASSSEKLAAKKVALNYKKTPLGAAVHDLRTQTGLNITLDLEKISDPSRKVTCVTGELPVWEALDAFCTAAGLKEEFRDELEVPKNQRRNGYIAVSPPPVSAETVPVVLIDGKPTRIVGDRRTAVRVLVLPPAFPGHRVTLGTGETTLCLDIAPAPGLNWQDLSVVKITRLIDDAGRLGSAGSPKPQSECIVPDDGFVVWGGLGPGGIQANGRFASRPIVAAAIANPRIHPIPLKLATPAARSIKRLEGSVFGEVMQSNQKLITITDPAKNTGTTYEGPGDMRLTVVSTTQVEGGEVMQLILEYPSPWTVSSRRGANPGGIWPETPRQGQEWNVQAFDASGKLIDPDRANPGPRTSADGTKILFPMHWTFPKTVGLPAKLVVTGPRSSTVEVPFVLENVPLP